MQIFPVQVFKKASGGYTFVELITVILIIGVLFSLVFPNFQNFLISSQNKKGISIFEDTLNSVSQTCMENKKTLYFFLDLESQEYWIEGETQVETEESEENEEINFSSLPEDIFIYKAKNSSYETTSDTISFGFFPDGIREFGLLYLKNLEDGKEYTIFLHPYSQRVKILEGEVYFD